MSALAAMGTAFPALAQRTLKMYRIGVLSGLPRSQMRLFGMLQSLGYEEGRNLVIDFKLANDRPELLAALAGELVAAKPDLILAFGNPEAAALKRATSAIPIVMMFSTAPVETGLIASLARPGGNVTGTTVNTPQVRGKMTQVLREMVPRLARLVWLSDPDYPGMDLYIKAGDEAAARMGVASKNLAVRTLPDLDAALAAHAGDRPDALCVSTTGVILANHRRIVEFASRAKIVALYTTRIPVIHGGLVSYGPDLAEIARRHAWMVDKILQGARPSEVPVEEPAKFLLSINMKTAKSMGLSIPRSLLMQADEVIE
jgi:putative ABC transport system substrate-binding protein